MRREGERRKGRKDTLAEPLAPNFTPREPSEEDDDEVDLFGSDDEEDDKEKEALAAKRLAEYQAKKALKPKTSKFTAPIVRWVKEMLWLFGCSGIR